MEDRVFAQNRSAAWEKRVFENGAIRRESVHRSGVGTRGRRGMERRRESTGCFLLPPWLARSSPGCPGTEGSVAEPAPVILGQLP